MEIVLMYNCSGPEFVALEGLLRLLQIPARRVEPNQYGLPLEEVLAQSSRRAPVPEPFDQPMLVFCGLSQARLERVLDALRADGVPSMDLKAVLTPTNRRWTSRRLWTELRREHAALNGAGR